MAVMNGFNQIVPRGCSYLFDEVDGRLQVEAKVNKLPLNALALIFFLLQDEHLKTSTKMLGHIVTVSKNKFPYQTILHKLVQTVKLFREHSPLGEGSLYDWSPV